MRIGKKYFKEFKSIFTGQDVLKENEEHANIVIATAMINMFIPLIIIFIISVFGMYKKKIVGIEDFFIYGFIGFIVSFVIGLFGLIIPARICYKRKGKGEKLKYLLLISLLITMAVVDILLTYKATLILVIPIIFAARYYSKNLTRNVAIITVILFAISTYVGANAGFLDLNYVKIPKGTTITVETTLEDSIEKLNLDKKENSNNLLINSYLPELLIYIFFIGYGCIQISHSGRNMIRRQKELTEEVTKVESELSIAKSIQSNMLETDFPVFSNHEEFDIYANMIPAKEVGGDFYDMFLIDDYHLGIVVADVSGKGIPGALIMMRAKVLIQSTALNGKPADEIFNIANNELCKKNKLNHFITSWLCIIDLVNGKLEYVNAGHNPPLIYKKSKNKFEYLKTKHNLALAAMEDIKYTKHEMKLNPGDRIFLYTDGVTEATNEYNELYGEERLRSYLNENINYDLNKTINGVKKDIDKFVGSIEQFDDITMLEFCFNDYKKEGKIFKANTKELNNVISYLKVYLNENNISQKIVKKLELVVEELFVNICNYAYEDNNGYFKISFNVSNSKIKIILEDEGIQFNPLEKEEPDITLSTEKRDVGGLGILLAKKNIDNIKYKREGNKNILILEKNIKED